MDEIRLITSRFLVYKFFVVCITLYIWLKTEFLYCFLTMLACLCAVKGAEALIALKRIELEKK